MIQFHRSVRAITSRAMIAALVAAFVPACKHKSSHSSPGQFSFAGATFTVNESESTVTITVSRTGGTSGAVTVHYFTANGSAIGTDYIGTAGQLSWADGEEGNRTFTVPIMSDGVAEGDETVRLTLANATGGALLSGPDAVLTIVEDDAVAGVYQFSEATYSAGEGAGTATVTVTRSGVITGAGTVNYATSDGTAGAGDYLAASGTLTFAPGETSQTFALTMLQDAAAEPSETVNLALSAPVGGILGTQQAAELTILDDDAAAAGRFTLDASSHAVGEDGGTVTITVNRASGSSPASFGDPARWA